MDSLDRAVAQVVNACVHNGARKATKFLTPLLTVKATRKRRQDRREKRTDLCLTLGRPNYEERKFIKLCAKSGQSFPVRKVQLKWFPAKRIK